jgi:MerR family copper efflux transcriptional regulator
MHHLFTAQTHGLEPYLYIGKVAEITGASCKAIRHYERLGLLPKPRRRGKYRIYSEQDVFLVHMIKCAQSVGFNLAELKELVLAKISKNRFPLQLAHTLLDKKRAALDEEIKILQALDQRIVDLKATINKVFGQPS